MTLTNAIPVAGKHLYLLPSAVEAIVNQTRKPEEAIIVLSDYMPEDDKIINRCKLMLANKGIKPIVKTFAASQQSGKNREIAYNECNTDIISYQDCDDITHRMRNEILLKIFKEKKAAQVLTSYYNDPDKVDFKHGYIEYDESKIFCVDDMNNSVKIFHKPGQLANTTHGAISLNKTLIDYEFEFSNQRVGQDVILVNNLLKLNAEKSNICKMYLARIPELYVWRTELSSKNQNEPDNRPYKKEELLRYLGLL